MCEEVWTRLRTTRLFFDERISDSPHNENPYRDRSRQSYFVGRHLAEWKREYEAVMEEFITAE